MNPGKHFSTRVTPQSEAIPGTSQVPNSAGGYAWKVDCWTQLDRFLILGTEGGTYYVKEKPLTQANCNAVLECIRRDGPRTVRQIVAVSDAGRAVKNDPALFALAMCLKLGDLPTRQAAAAAVNEVARIGTHLFHLAEMIKSLGGWGRITKTAFRWWYGQHSAGELAYQALKYKQRDGWSHRDILRKAHPKTSDPVIHQIYRWITHGELPEVTDSALDQLRAAIVLGQTTDRKAAARLIVDYHLPREAVPTGLLAYPEIWEALLHRMPLEAMVRNLGNMSKVGLLAGVERTGRLAPMSDPAKQVAAALEDAGKIRHARMHPLKLLVALNIYQSGQGYRGSGTWVAVPQICDALDRAFYLAFQNVAPTGKNLLLALDISGSMTWSRISGMNITPRTGAVAMAMVTAKVEPNYLVCGFCHEFRPLPAVTAAATLSQAEAVVDNLPQGSTDCSLPMLAAKENKWQVDTFVVYTDSETWWGSIHPVQALRQYREWSGRPAKLIVVGMVSNGFTIADPTDAGMLDVVGFDTSTPQVISEFSK